MADVTNLAINTPGNMTTIPAEIFTMSSSTYYIRAPGRPSQLRNHNMAIEITGLMRRKKVVVCRVTYNNFLPPH
jgi:hypothetical protein